MSYEEICEDNRLSYEAMELIIRMIAVNKALKRDNMLFDTELSDIKKRIAVNLRQIA